MAGRSSDFDGPTERGGDFSTDPTMPAPAESSRSSKRYRRLRQLGAGGMGAVHLAVDEVLGKEVALKVIRPDRASRGEGLGELRAEVLLAQKVTHRNVCRIYDLDEVDGDYLVKMEFVDGATLAARLGSGPLPVAEVLRIARDVVRGLAAAHEQRVVHRDLKPHNVMIEKGTGRVVLLDFGLALAAASPGQQSGTAGTPEYMAPEQMRGEPLDGRADLYSLGAMLYQLLVGEVPFPDARERYAQGEVVSGTVPDVRASRPEVPPWLAATVARLLEADRDRRFPDAGAVLAALYPPSSFFSVRNLAIAAALLLAGAATLALLRRAPAGAEWRPSVHELQPAYDETSETPKISPDGKWVAYPSDREQTGRWRLFVSPLTGGPSRAVTPSAIDASNPRWSRDGRSIYFLDFAALAVDKISLDGGPVERIAASAKIAEECGDALLITYLTAPDCATCGRLVVRASDGKERLLFQSPPGEELRWPRCDREGRRVAYGLGNGGRAETEQSASHLWLLDLAGGPPRRLTTGDPPQTRYAAFAPDGASVVYSLNRAGKINLWEQPIAGGAPIQRTFGEGPDTAPDISLDGKNLLFDIDNTSFPIFAQPTDGGARRRLTGTIEDWSVIRAFPDGRELVSHVERRGTQLVIALPLDGGEERILGEGIVPAITLDGETVLFGSADVPPRLLAVSRAGGAIRTVAQLPGPLVDLAAGPDGNAHASLRLPGGVEAWRIPLSGGVPSREAPPPYCQLVPAPSGGWIAAERCDGARSEIRLLSPGMHLDDPAARTLAARGWSWDLDGRSLIYWTGTEIRRLPVSGAAESKLFTATMAEWIAASPDGKTIYYPDPVAHVHRHLITNFADRPRPW
jgi:serine/threonine protein kinase